MVIIVNKEVDLSKYELRTDLAIESINSVSDKNGIKTSIKNIDEIKEKLLKNEIYAKVKDYSKERNKVLTYFEVGKLLSEAGKEYGNDIIF